MTPVSPPRRSIVLRADRDTIWLLAAAIGMTLALGYSLRNRPPARPAAVVAQVSAGQWAGDLAAPPASAPAPAEVLSSAALTVPKAAMILPAAPAAPPARARGCATCAAPTKTVAAPAAVAQRRLAAPARPVREASLADRLNPLNHLPDSVTRPFASAGDTIVAWVRRF